MADAFIMPVLRRALVCCTIPVVLAACADSTGSPTTLADSTAWYLEVTGSEWPRHAGGGVLLSAAPAPALSLSGSGSSEPVVLDFEDLPAGTGMLGARRPYHGVYFSAENASTCPTVYWYDYAAFGKAHSGSRYIYNGCGKADEYLRFPTPVMFDGAWVGNPHRVSDPKDFWFEGYRNGVLVATSPRIRIRGGAPMVWLGAEFEVPVDKVYFRRFSNVSGWWVADDIAFTPLPTDLTPPLVTPELTGTVGAEGWYTSDVHLTWRVSDGESAVASATGCEEQSVASDHHGLTFTCTASSAGGSATRSVTVRRDATRPVVTLTGDVSYTVDQTIAIACSADDATSGIATGCEDYVRPAAMLGVGTHRIAAEAADRAGNVEASEITVAVAVTEASLCTLARRWASASLAPSLCAKLTAMAQARATGRTNARARMAAALRHELEAQRGKGIAAADTDALLELLRHL